MGKPNHNSNKEHRVILAACRPGDAVAAARAVAAHVNGVRKIVLVSVLRERGQS